MCQKVNVSESDGVRAAPLVGGTLLLGAPGKYYSFPRLLLQDVPHTDRSQDLDSDQEP